MSKSWIDLTGIKAILFDMDDVLCRLDDVARIGYLHRLSGLDHDHIEKAIWGSGFEDRADVGEFTADEYLAEFGSRIGYPISRAQWCEYRRGGMTPFPWVLSIASAWSRDYRVGVLTNNGLLLRDEIDKLFPELRPIFAEHIYCSAEFGVRKPDPRVFTMVCERMGVMPHETFFIDDREENVEGAKIAGLQGYHFESLERFTYETR